MTYSPQRLKDERDVWILETGLPAVSLGIQHFAAEGGGYHEGNDLLAAAGRLNSDYSKRQSERDRPGTNGASAIDIGYFDVNVQKVDGSWRRVTLDDYTRWLINQLNAGAPDVSFVRELIYSLDRVNVKRWDRLGQSTTGDSSHRTHNHRSDFRDDEEADKAAHVRRFWREMRGQSGGTFMAGILDNPINADRLAFRIEALVKWLDTVGGSADAAGNNPEINAFKAFLVALDHKADLLLAEAAADKTRDTALAAAVQALATAGGGSVDVAAVINAVNAAAGDVKSTVLAELEQAREAQAAAARAAAEALDDEQ